MLSGPSMTSLGACQNTADDKCGNMDVPTNPLSAKSSTRRVYSLQAEDHTRKP